MSHWKAYEYVLFTNPSDDKVRPLIIAGPMLILAKDEKDARTEAARKIPDEYATDEVTIQIRPF